MKFETKKQPDYRIIKRFAFFPYCVERGNGTREYRFFEMVYIFQTPVVLTGEWTSYRFVGKKEYEQYKKEKP